MVRLIEAHFELVAICNNVGGTDAKILKRFGEPAWNHQVVRFSTHEGKEVLPRRDGIKTIGGIAARMIATLEKQKREVPKELPALVEK